MIISISDPCVIAMLMAVVIISFGKLIHHYITAFKDEDEKKEKADG